MENVEIARVLNAYADLLDIQGDSPFRVRAYRIAAQTVASLSQPVVQLIEAGEDLEKLPGIGSSLAEHIAEIVATGTLSRLEEVRRTLPSTLTELMQLEHLVAGSYRRRQETVGDIDILATCENPRPVMQHFQSYRDVDRVEMAGPTRGTVILRSGLQVDLRIVPRRSYGAALHYFIGSKAHNVAVRKLGVERGLRINEYGIFRVTKGKKAEALGVEGGKRIGGEKEEDVFRAVGLVWIPPELREDRGEIQAAQQRTLPHLISLNDIRGDLHMHSTWSDGAYTIEAMARACQERGYEYCAITDHSKSTRVAGGLDAAGFRRQWKEIEALRQRLDGIVLLTGVELDILPDGSLDLPDDVLEQFDIVLISVHSQLGMPKARMTKRVLKALSHPAVDTLAHPTGRQIRKRAPVDIDLEAVFQAAKELDVALELDAQPQRLDLNDVHLHRAHELGVKIAIDSDAHSIEHLRFMQYGIDQARRGWLDTQQVVNTLSWPQLHRWLERRRA